MSQIWSRQNGKGLFSNKIVKSMGARSYGQGGALAPPGILAFTLENLAVCGILGVRSDQESWRQKFSRLRRDFDRQY